MIKKFRDMTDSEKLEIIVLMIADDKVEVLTLSGNYNKAIGGVCLDDCYRIPPRPMSVDWSVLKDEYICAMRTESGSAFAYKAGPDRVDGYLIYPIPAVQIDHLKSYDPGTTTCDNSLIWRPGHGRP